MGAERLLMRQIREILRLRFAIGLGQHVIARSLGLSQGTVSKYLVIASKAGLSWPLPVELDDDTPGSVAFSASAAAADRSTTDARVGMGA